VQLEIFYQNQPWSLFAYRWFLINNAIGERFLKIAGYIATGL